MTLIDEYLDQIQLQEFVITPSILLSIAIYKKYISKASKACSKFKGKQKNRCMLMYKIIGRRSQATKIKQSMSKCSKDKSPEKCKKRADEELDKVRLKMSKLATNLKSLQ